MAAEIFLLILAIWGESAVPIIAMVAIPLIAGVSLLLVKIQGKHLSLILQMNDLTEPGGSLIGQIKVANQGTFPFSLISVEVETKNLLTGEVHSDKIPVSVGTKSEAVAKLEVNCTLCGRIRLTVTEIHLYDLFGFFYVTVPCKEKVKALVLPNIFPMEITITKSNTVEPECDTFSPYKAGNDPTETFGIRDYAPGDALRSIHWKLTGKYDRLMIREAGLPVNESVLILFERICPDSANFASPAVRAALGEIAVSLSQSLTERNVAHTLGWLRSENGTFLGHRVDSEESFQLIMAELLSVSEMRGEEDTIESYLKTNDINTYANIVYLTAHSADHLSLLPDLASKTAICCTEKEVAEGTEERSYIVTPKDYDTALYQIMI